MAKGILNSIKESLFPVYSICVVCEKEDKSSLKTGFCSACTQTLPFCNDANAVFYYKEPIKTSIHHWKYDNKRYYSDIFAPFVKSKTENINYDILTFVPMFAEKQKQRGYNQVELLANLVNKNKVLNLLSQIKSAPSQAELSYHDRLVSRTNIYKFNSQFNIENKNVLLLDDVRTTGATVAECCKVLKNNGARSISVFTVCKSEK